MPVVMIRLFRASPLRATDVPPQGVSFAIGIGQGGRGHQCPAVRVPERHGNIFPPRQTSRAENKHSQLEMVVGVVHMVDFCLKFLDAGTALRTGEFKPAGGRITVGGEKIPEGSDP